MFFLLSRQGLCEEFAPFGSFRDYAPVDLPPFSDTPPQSERPFSDIPGLNLPQFPDLTIPFGAYDDRYDRLQPPLVALPPYAEPGYLPFSDMRSIEQPPLEDEVLQPFAPFHPMY